MIKNFASDEVYEEFEVFYVIEAAYLGALAGKAPLVWKISESQAFEVTNLKHAKKIANFFIMRVQIYNGKFLVAVPGLKSYEFETCRVINEETLRLIQNQFRNKKYYRNYKKYRQICFPDPRHPHKRDTANIHVNQVREFHNKKYYCIVFENKKKQLEVNIWDMETYQMYATFIEIQNISQFYNYSQKETCIEILNQIKIDYQLANQQMKIKINSKGIYENLRAMLR